MRVPKEGSHSYDVPHKTLTVLLAIKQCVPVHNSSPKRAQRYASLLSGAPPTTSIADTRLSPLDTIPLAGKRRTTPSREQHTHPRARNLWIPALATHARSRVIKHLYSELCNWSGKSMEMRIVVQSSKSGPAPEAHHSWTNPVQVQVQVMDAVAELENDECTISTKQLQCTTYTSPRAPEVGRSKKDH